MNVALHRRNMMIFLLAFPAAKFVNGSDMFPSGHRAQLLIRALCGNFNTYILFYAIREGSWKAGIRLYIIRSQIHCKFDSRTMIKDLFSFA